MIENTFERRRWLIPAILALLVVILFRPVILPPQAGQVLNGNDFVSMFYPLQQYIRQTLQGGELPLWNPHQFIGVPLVGNPHAALFYPGSWLVWLIGVQRGIGLLMVLHVWWGAWGMARLVRGFGTTYTGSLLAGVVFGMSGWVGARFFIGHYNLILVWAWIPWAMVAYRFALTHTTWAALLPGTGVLGAAVLAGYPPLLIYMGWGLLALAAWHVARSPEPARAARYAALRLIGIGIGGAILGAALLLPAAELSQRATRSANDLTFANSHALPPAQLLSALALPDLFGNPKTPPSYYWGADFYEEFTAYAGLMPLLAIPLIFRWMRREAWFFLGLIGLGLVLSIGVEGALMPLLVRWIPGYGFFRVPARGLLLVVMGMAGLTALLVTALQTSAPDERQTALQPALRLWIPAAVTLAFALSVFFSGWYASASHVEPMPHRAMQIAGVLAEAGLILCGVWVVLWLWARPDVTRWALGLTAALVILDAWHVMIPIMTVDQVPEAPIWTGARANVPTTPDARVLVPLGGPMNEASVSGYYHVLGYDPLPIAAFDKLQQSGDWTDPAGRVNTLLGVKYFFSTQPYDNPDFELIGIAYGSYYYARRDPFPRAWIAQHVAVEPNDQTVRSYLLNPDVNLLQNVFLDRALPCAGGGGTAAITAYGPNKVTITTDGDGGVLVLSDQYYPGWRATIDGQRVEIVRADTVFRAVCIPPGAHTVKFEYRPMSFYAGVIVSAAGWAGWLVLAALAGWRARQKRIGLLTQIASENLHGESEWGAQVGKELW
jgi:hypothetical protein